MKTTTRMTMCLAALATGLLATAKANACSFEEAQKVAAEYITHPSDPGQMIGAISDVEGNISATWEPKPGHTRDEAWKNPALAVSTYHVYYTAMFRRKSDNSPYRVVGGLTISDRCQITMRSGGKVKPL